jgi:hypothetical protein
MSTPILVVATILQVTGIWNDFIFGLTFAGRENLPMTVQLNNIVKMLNDPQITFTTTPQNVLKYVEFMNRTGAIKVKPASWKDLFFPNAHALPGS